MVIVYKVMLFLFAGLRSVKISISLYPYREMTKVCRFELAHVRNFIVHIKLSNPLLIRRILVKDVRSDLAVLLVLSFAAVAQHFYGLRRPLLYENIVIEAVISVQDGHKAHDLRAVRHMIRRITPAGAAAHHREGAADQVVHHGNTLRRNPERIVGKKNVVINQSRAMSNLYKDILAHHAALKLTGKFRPLIVVKQVLRDAGSLCFPVSPDSHRAVMNVIAAHGHVDCSMHLDAGNLRTSKLHHIVDVMDVVVLNDAEDTTLTADDSALLAVMNVVSANDMASHLLLQPAMVLSAADCIAFHLRRALHMMSREEVIVLRIIIFPDRNAGALTAPDLAVFNDPALGPVRSDHAVLIGCGRSPGRCSLVDVEAADRNIIDSVLLREEALPADCNLHILLCGICALEVCINDRLIGFFILLGIPLQLRCLRIPGALIHFAGLADLQRGCLVQCLIIQPDTAGMLVTLCKIPVTEHIRCIRIVAAENRVVHTCHPYISLVRLPVLHLFRTGDFRAQRLGAAIGDACLFRSCMNRLHILTIGTRRNQNLISRHRCLCRLSDPAVRHLLRSVSVTSGLNVYINLHNTPLSPFSGLSSLSTT